MELWIRSQDKETLMKANYFEIEQRDKNFLIMVRDGNHYFDQCLGLYKTKERALEVLDEIQNILREPPLVKGYFGYKYGSQINDLEIKRYMKNVYEMPKE